MINLFSLTRNCFVLTIVCVAFLFAAKADGATYFVNQINDDNLPVQCTPNVSTPPGTCSLREAIAAANLTAESDFIEFSLSGAAITLELTIADGLTTGNDGSRDLDIQPAGLGNAGSLTITGPGANSLFVTTNNQGRIFDVAAGATATITGLTVTNGDVGGDVGGGIRNAGALTLENVEVTFNSAQRAGGIFNSDGGTLNINQSLLANNRATERGGAIFTQGTLRISNATISGNGRDALGNAITVFGGGINIAGGSAAIRNATIANNAAVSAGGGIAVAGGTLDMANTIVADNQTGFQAPDILGAFASQGNNLVRNQADSSGYIASDLPNGTDPMLGALADNGGQTRTHALVAGSPAVNAGNNAQAVNPATNLPLAFDQRGAGFPRITNVIVDIGAFETPGVTAASVSIGGRVLSSSGRGVFGARVSITDSTGETRTAQTNAFGYYRLADIAPGQTVIVTVVSKRYQFAPQVVSVSEEISGLNFVGER